MIEDPHRHPPLPRPRDPRCCARAASIPCSRACTPRAACADPRELASELRALLPPGRPAADRRGRRVSGRRHRRPASDDHRRRLRLRRRDRLRRRHARPARDGRARSTTSCPNRFEYGYGLTPEIVELAAREKRSPDILITVDNGIASVDGVAAAQRARHRRARHRPPPAGRRSCRDARVHRQSEPAGLRLPEQAPGRRRRDVLRAAGAARRTAPARRVRRRDAAASSTRCSISSRWAPWPTS